MGKFLAVFGAFVLIIMIAVYMGWFGISASSSSDGNHEKVEVTMDKDKIRSDTAKVTDNVKEISRDASEGARKIATKVENSISNSSKPQLIADKKSVEIEAGSSAAVKVTRTGSKLAAAHLTLTASPGSNLILTGGEYKADETETTVTIEAHADSKSGSVTVEGNGDSQRVDVVVKARI